MVLGFNNMNMLNMNGNMFGFGSNNMLGGLFSGTGSIFDNSGFNMFGMNGGCSLFTDCNGQPNYGAMAGWGVGLTVMNIVTGVFGHHLAEKKANSQEAVQADIDGIQKQIDSNLDKLGSDVTESDYESYDVKTEDWYRDGIDELKDDILSEADLKSYGATYEDYKDKQDAFGKANKSDANYETLKSDYEKIKEQGELAKEKLDAHKQAVKDKKALEKKAKTEQEKVDKIISKIAELIEQRDNAQAILDDKKLDKAIGKEKKLISDTDYNNAIKSHDDEDTANDVKFTKAHLQKAAAKYRKAKTDEDKTKYKNEFDKIYTWLLNNNSGEITDDLATIADMILS